MTVITLGSEMYVISIRYIKYRGESGSGVRQIITVHREDNTKLHCEDNTKIFIVRLVRNLH